MTKGTLPTGHESALLPDTHERASEIASQVMEYVDEIHDPHTELHALFYGENGVSRLPLTEARRPASGHTILLKNEIQHAVTLSDGNRIPVPTFKRRGALAATYFALRSQPALQTVVTASAGNHGQGIAAAAAQLDLNCVVFGKDSISPVKQVKMQALEAKVLPGGDTLAEAMKAAETYTARSVHSTYLHPFNQTEVIAGQATVGSELLEDLLTRHETGQLDLDTDPIDILVPTGGGGLVAGIAIVFAEARARGLIGKEVRVVSVFAEEKPLNNWCDGTATTTGTLPSVIIDDPLFVQAHITVSDLEIADAMHALTSIYHRRIEPAGALAYAGAQAIARNHQTRDGNARRTLVAPVTGASVSEESYAYAMQLRQERQAQVYKALTALFVEQSDIFDTPYGSTARSTQVMKGFFQK